MRINKNQRSYVRLIALITLLDAATSQIYIDYLINDFRISVSVILLPVIYFYNRKINPVLTSVCIGTFGLLFRGLIGMGHYGGFFNAIMVDWPIFIFDLTYGLIYYFLFYHMQEKRVIKWFVIIWICDFAANLLEMTVRLGGTGSDSMAIVNTLLSVGFFRSSMALALVYAYKYYQVIFQQEAKYEKYRAFYTVFADLKSEIYFMKENMDHIEDVMSEAYQLYEHSAQKDDEFATESALKIAKDVHEIKKNYHKVIDGINKIGKSEANYDTLEIRELMRLLYDYYDTGQELLPISIEIVDGLQSNYKIKRHFLLMSIMRNLLSNSIEAADNGKYTVIELRIHDDEHSLYIEVKDNGKGIKPKDLEHIFRPGYSTKFNEETGDIYRGLGLTLVKDIVENQFKGHMTVDSTWGKGTTFKISLDKTYLGV